MPSKPSTPPEGAAVVAVLDLVFALNPTWAANGILHFILLQAQKLVGTPPPPAA